LNKLLSLTINQSIARISAILPVSVGSLGQTIALPEFVAAVKLNRSGGTQANGGVLPGGQLSFRNMTMNMLLQFAYGVSRRYMGDYITGGQSWFDSDRFDVVAKAPLNTPDKSLALMVQNLLARDFKLATHRIEKPMNVYALALSKGKSTLQKAGASASRTANKWETKEAKPGNMCFAQT
jgi:uncharacterized protein (TIGR03435 family)